MNTDTVSGRFASVSRSRTFMRIVRMFGLRQKKVLDLGCGYGEYLAHFGQGSVGVTTTSDEVSYGRTHAIDIRMGNAERLDELALPSDFDAVWANNLFEHLLSPHSFLIKLKRAARPDALLILGVPVVPRLASLVRVRQFRGALSVMHINFFTRETVRLTVERAGWTVRDVRPFLYKNATLDYLCSFFAPHLYVVAHNDAQFTYADKKLKEWQDDPAYHELLMIAGNDALAHSAPARAVV